MRPSAALLIAPLAALTPIGTACEDGGGARRGGEDRAAPVEVGPITRGPLTRIRTYSGALQATAEVTAAAKVAGRVETVPVDLGGAVASGEVLVTLEDDELRFAARQAAAELAVARAQLVEARRAAEIATRDLERVETLRKRGVSSEATLDTSRATQVARAAAVEVATAQVARAEATRDAARLRVSFTKVALTWPGEAPRAVARRQVDPGQLVAVNDPLVTLVALDPLEAVVFVPEADYRFLSAGQRVTVRTEARKGETFEGRVARVAPVFEPGSRQARVEIEVPNPTGQLTPGMFVRASIELETVDDAVIVPKDALTTREDRTGVFVLDDDARTVHWRPVEPGIVSGDRVQIVAPALPEGRVVTLGHQLIDDGSKVRLPKPAAAEAPAADAAP